MVIVVLLLIIVIVIIVIIIIITITVIIIIVIIIRILIVIHTYLIALLLGLGAEMSRHLCRPAPSPARPSMRRTPGRPSAWGTSRRRLRDNDDIIEINTQYNKIYYFLT